MVLENFFGCNCTIACDIVSSVVSTDCLSIVQTVSSVGALLEIVSTVVETVMSV